MEYIVGELYHAAFDSHSRFSAHAHARPAPDMHARHHIHRTQAPRYLPVSSSVPGRLVGDSQAFPFHTLLTVLSSVHSQKEVLADILSVTWRLAESINS